MVLLSLLKPFIEIVFINKIFVTNLGDKIKATKDGGMGLGLAISDEIIKLHGGKIDVESNLGNSTLFIVSLPKRTLIE